MAFGKQKDDASGDKGDEAVSASEVQDPDLQGDDDLDGPFDIEDFDDPATATVGRLDLGSVLIPLPEAGQVHFLSKLFGRRSKPEAPANDFEDLFTASFDQPSDDSVEDQELRAKLAMGLGARTR